MIQNICLGATLYYDFMNWKVIDDKSYYTPKSAINRQLMLSSSNKILYLEIEGSKTFISKKITTQEIKRYFPNFHKKPGLNKAFQYHDKTYHFIKKSKEKWLKTTEQSTDFTTEHYQNESNVEHSIIIKYPSSDEIEIYIREKINSNQITNIIIPTNIPSSSKKNNDLLWMMAFFLFIGIGLVWLINYPRKKTPHRHNRVYKKHNNNKYNQVKTYPNYQHPTPLKRNNHNYSIPKTQAKPSSNSKNNYISPKKPTTPKPRSKANYSSSKKKRTTNSTSKISRSGSRYSSGRSRGRSGGSGK